MEEEFSCRSITKLGTGLDKPEPVFGVEPDPESKPVPILEHGVEPDPVPYLAEPFPDPDP